MWRNKTVQRAKSPNTVLCSPSRESGEAHTDLLNAVCPYTIIFYLFLHDIFLMPLFSKFFLPPLTTAVVHGRTTAL
jgi:hypothetical protein